MPRKTTDSEVARQEASALIGAATAKPEDAENAVALFKSVEFETATTRIGGEDVSVRRVVLTGPWEVVAQGN